MLPKTRALVDIDNPSCVELVSIVKLPAVVGCSSLGGVAAGKAGGDSEAEEASLGVLRNSARTSIFM